MPGFYLLPVARDDLDRLAEFLASTQSLETAMRFVDAADTTFKEVSRMPGIGERHDSERSGLAGLRKVSISGFMNHIVFYQELGDEIVVVRVLHGSRDFDQY